MDGDATGLHLKDSVRRSFASPFASALSCAHTKMPFGMAQKAPNKKICMHFINERKLVVAFYVDAHTRTTAHIGAHENRFNALHKCICTLPFSVHILPLIRALVIRAHKTLSRRLSHGVNHLSESAAIAQPYECVAAIGMRMEIFGVCACVCALNAKRFAFVSTDFAFCCDKCVEAM